MPRPLNIITGTLFCQTPVKEIQCKLCNCTFETMFRTQIYCQACNPKINRIRSKQWRDKHGRRKTNSQST
jgi:hypothetical protein